MLISPQGTLVMTTPAEIEGLFARMWDALRGRQDARSELTHRHVRQAADRIAFVNVSRVRYRTDGTELERLGETYTLRKGDDGWKIAVAVVHEPGEILQPE